MNLCAEMYLSLIGYCKKFAIIHFIAFNLIVQVYRVLTFSVLLSRHLTVESEMNYGVYLLILH